MNTTWTRRVKSGATKAGGFTAKWLLILAGILGVLFVVWFLIQAKINRIREEGRQQAIACLQDLENCQDNEIVQAVTESNASAREAGHTAATGDFVTCLAERQGVGCPDEVQDALNTLLAQAASNARQQATVQERTAFELELWIMAAKYFTGELPADELPPAAYGFVQAVEAARIERVNIDLEE